jgi:large subunit ribosomal protein L10
LIRKEKEQQVAWLHEQMDGAKALFLTNFRGLTVSEMNALRSELREKGASYKVLKNTLARLAAQGTDSEVLEPDMKEPRAAAWVFNDEDIPTLAKTLIDFKRNHPNLEMVSGVTGGQRLEANDLEELSKLPSREELLAKLLGTMVAPISSFVGVLAAVPRSMVTVLNAIAEKKEGEPDSGAQ